MDLMSKRQEPGNRASVWQLCSRQALLELDLPDMDGSEVVARLRSWSAVQIIIISKRCSETDKVLLLDQGADDYITKPFGIAELVARSRAVMRRAARVFTAEPVVHAGPLTIDLPAKRVRVREALVSLTAKEYMLLQILAQNVDKVVTQQGMSEVLCMRFL